ncbi:NUMOD4 domain-containing protein [Citrobacter freundii]|uniref:NUMOD4 domain-containing protein n=1 Tax=Citrobacter freundii TaxID=546 RepID=UPI004041341C
MADLRKAARGRECLIDEGNERWRPVLGFEGLYEISNFGRVRSVSRWVNIGSGKRLSEGKIIAQSIKAGYPTVCLCNRGVEKYRSVHRILAEAFIVGSGDVVRHIDGDKLNCVEENLAWGSYAENESDKRDHGRNVFGESHGQAKLTTEKVRQIRDMHLRGITQLSIAKSMGVSRATVSCVIRGETWGHVK